MADVSTDRGLPHIDPAAAQITGVLSRPRAIAAVCIVVLAATGWLYLGLLAGFVPGSDTANYLAALCRPVLTGQDFSAGAAALVALMWVAMTLAMMLPSAGPMILTYAEIADTAARKGERIVSPLVLAGGYLAVWFGFALAAAALQVGIMRIAGFESAMTQAYAPIAAVLFIGAGLYQFSALKQACLSVCQRPFPFFFMNWTDRASGVFRLGVRQGLHCVGCCCAMMLLMFAAGTMNVVWMALLGLVMVIEKLSKTTRFSRIVGAGFIVAGTMIAAAWIGGLELNVW